MSLTVTVKVLADHWGYWNGSTTELLSKGDIRENVDRGMAEREAARKNIEILNPSAKPKEKKVEKEPDLHSMTVAQLRKLASDRKIDLGDARKKADILEKLED